jgi:nucleoside-diphosphate-sugar epimerase
MKVLLVGGTGAIGKELFLLLQSLDIDVYYSSRNPSFSIEKSFKGDSKNLDFLRKLLLIKWDIIVDFMVYDFLEFQDRYQLFLKNTKHYVFLSSARVYSNNDLTPLQTNSKRLIDLKEDYNYLATNEYGISKCKQEDLLLTNEYKNFSIARPYITFGSNRLQLLNLEKELWLSRVLSNKSIIVCEEVLNNFTSITSSADVSILLKLIIEKKPNGRVFNLASNEMHLWSEILQFYSNVIYDILKIRMKVKIISKKEYYSSFGFSYQIEYDRLFNRVFASDPSFSDFKFRNSLSSLKKDLGIFLKNPSFLSINYRYEAISDRITNENTNFLSIKGVKNKISYIKYRYFDFLNSKGFIK